MCSCTCTFVNNYRNRRKKHVVYIATIEKANGLVNSLIEHGRLLSLGLLVVDEVHVNPYMFHSFSGPFLLLNTACRRPEI